MTQTYENNILPPKWRKRYIELSEFIAQWSKDPSTKCGAVIVRPDKTIASIGYNGLPKEIPDTDDILHNRERKLQKIVHAEGNAFRNARENSFLNYHIFTWPFMPCSACAELILLHGVRFVYAPETPKDKLSRWKDEFQKSTEMFEHHDVTLTIMKEEHNNDIE